MKTTMGHCNIGIIFLLFVLHRKPPIANIKTEVLKRLQCNDKLDDLACRFLPVQIK